MTMMLGGGPAGSGGSTGTFTVRGWIVGNGAGGGVLEAGACAMEAGTPGVGFTAAAAGVSGTGGVGFTEGV